MASGQPRVPHDVRPAGVMPLPAAANDDAVIAGADDARLGALAAKVARDLGRGVDIAAVRAALEVLARTGADADADADSVTDAPPPPITIFEPGEPITILASDICAALGADQLLELHDCEGGEAEFDEWGDVVVYLARQMFSEVLIALIVQTSGIACFARFTVSVRETKDQGRAISSAQLSQTKEGCVA